jgi:hypothetical protein
LSEAELLSCLLEIPGEVHLISPSASSPPR